MVSLVREILSGNFESESIISRECPERLWGRECIAVMTNHDMWSREDLSGSKLDLEDPFVVLVFSEGFILSPNLVGAFPGSTHAKDTN